MSCDITHAIHWMIAWKNVIILQILRFVFCSATNCHECCISYCSLKREAAKGWPKTLGALNFKQKKFTSSLKYLLESLAVSDLPNRNGHTILKSAVRNLWEKCPLLQKKPDDPAIPAGYSSDSHRNIREDIQIFLYCFESLCVYA